MPIKQKAEQAEWLAPDAGNPDERIEKNVGIEDGENVIINLSQQIREYQLRNSAGQRFIMTLGPNEDQYNPRAKYPAERSISSKSLAILRKHPVFRQDEKSKKLRIMER